MKTNKFLIASLLILIGMGAITTSCEKQKATFKKAQLIINNNAPKTGDDDDDPIIQGKVKKKTGHANLNGTRVDTYEYGTNVRVETKFTDTAGDFTEQIKQGTYYFKVVLPGSSSQFITDTFPVYQNTSVTILVD